MFLQQAHPYRIRCVKFIICSVICKWLNSKKCTLSISMLGLQPLAKMSLRWSLLPKAILTEQKQGFQNSSICLSLWLCSRNVRIFRLPKRSIFRAYLSVRYTMLLLSRQRYRKNWLTHFPKGQKKYIIVRLTVTEKSPAALTVGDFIIQIRFSASCQDLLR